MSDGPKYSVEQINLIKAALATISKQENNPTPAKQKARQGHRYSKSEKAAVVAAVQAGRTPEEVSVQYGMCRETINTWVRRSEHMAQPATTQAGESTEKSKDSQHTAGSEGSDQHKGYHAHWHMVLKVWKSRPGIGPAQIRDQLFRQGIRINVATVRKIMEENGYTPHKATIKDVGVNRYEAVRPLELVHMDFKHFYINKHKTFLLLAQDDFSRFLLGHRATSSENMDAVTGLVDECINRHGKMQSLMTDAGSAFYSWNGVNRFQKLLSEEYGIDHIKAGSPRSNGKIENVNKQIEKEVLDVKLYASLEDANAAILEWIRYYNFERTHMGLPQGMVPADRFMPGWNTSLSPTPAADTAKTEESVWKDVLNFALEKLKRVA